MSQTAADDMIRSWKIARLSSDSALGYPKVNILAKCALYGGGVGVPVYSESIDASQLQDDADTIQTIVFLMPKERKQAFEAFHLGIIHQERHRELSHKERAIRLGIKNRKTYYNRVDQARDFIIERLDNLHTFARIV